MLNKHHGFKVAVIVPATGFPFVVVPPHQVDDVHRLLNEHGIGHALPPDRGGNAGNEQVINIARLWEREWVQDVLDSVQ